MIGDAMPDRERIENAWSAYDLGEIRACVHHAGTAAKTWRIETRTGKFLLRTRGTRTSSDALIAFDHAFREHLTAGGIPTATPLRTKTGETYTRVGEKALEVYRLMPGKTLGQTDDKQLAAAARFLARFHQVSNGFRPARELPAVSQYRTLGVRDASCRMENPALLTRIYEPLLAQGAAAYPEAVATCGPWLARLARDFGDAVYDALPRTVTHGDFTLANLLFGPEGKVCGVFDFDWVRYAPRVRDLADGLYFIGGVRRTPLQAGSIWSLTEAVGLTVERCVRWLLGYRSRTSLSRDELRVLPLALAARWLSVRVEGMAKVPQKDRLRFALENAAGPLLWLEDRWAEVLAALS